MAFRTRPRALGILLLGTAMALVAGTPASADKIKNPTAIFAGLDKITGRIISFEVAVDETVQFGALQLTPRVCFTRPATEPQNTTAFIEVDEVTFNNEYRRIFSGWVFASSPGLHGIEHPIYDVWLTGCKGGTEVIAEAPDPDKVEPPKATAEAPKPAPAAAKKNPAGVQVGTGQIGVAAPQGVPVAPKKPTQRFYPAEPRGTPVEAPAPVESRPLDAPPIPPANIPLR